ncbi:hypothetical protein Q9L58_003119 [Maublancomyces gigas]|uniref:Uncharacterized protein n=1 Tax=Discina gigas TaxID=1032678 RepID=A0ABR3GPQ2_9PEZI
MSLPRLSFLYPSLRFSKRLLYPVAAARRHRHGTAVEPKAPDTASPNLKVETVIRAEEEVEDKPPSSQTSIQPNSPSPSPPSPSVSPSPHTAVLGLAGEWVHHFDTYGLAKHLESSGFRNEQAITIMKGIRGLLTQNLEIAKESLVSRSNVENESYLFHAACSELRNEIQHTRKTHIDQLRADGAAIQQEYDLLNQKFLEHMMSLKDELNGLFNDRKMVTRAEQRAMDNKIQELNYKITVLVCSDVRTDIEKLRWTTTRRGLIAIAALAVLVVSSIRLSRSGHNEKRKSKEKNEHNDTHDSEGRPLPDMSFVTLG